MENARSLAREHRYRPVSMCIHVGYVAVAKITSANPRRCTATRQAAGAWRRYVGYTTGWNLIAGREEDLALPNVLAAGARNRLRGMFL